MSPGTPTDRDTPYKRPRRETPHPDETPLDPYSPRELIEEPETEFKRTLIMFAKKIRTCEAQLKSELATMGKPQLNDLRKATINVRHEMVHNPANYPAAKRASTAQSNLRSHYDRWATLCEQHLTRVRHMKQESGRESEDSE